MNAVVQKIERVLRSDFSTDNYIELIREIFTKSVMISPDKFNKEYTNFSSHIEGSIHIANYQTPDDKLLLIFAVQLKREAYVENSRSTQRSYAKKLIENGDADAALIAFYTEGDPKWRLSFVRLDYEMKIERGRLRATEDITPAKRYSYLVGNEEPCHTAIEQFHKFVTDSNSNPTLEELEESFSVEKVTNEFFDLYKEKYIQVKEHLEQNEDFVIEAEQHNFTSAQFAKKMLGQIVFLYFLQKKGWLGVSAWPRKLTDKEYRNAFYAQGKKSRELIPLVYKKRADDENVLNGAALNEITDEDEETLSKCVKGNPWGSGPHNFMRKLFEFSHNRGANYFDDFLEPLFYDALNKNRGESGYDSELHCRIPFLSGGLFEPIDGYDWEHNDFAIPNELFSNRESESDREGDGILDIFDRYNFTMSEDEPMEREVAIDPEMLGKVFENLLDVNDRKSKGAFYTPREIVHYMCQESLIAYLVSETKLKEGDVRDFILYGDIMKDEDTIKEKREGNGGMLISEDIYKIGTSGELLVDGLKDIDEALEKVRIADPAVGSGAFLLGMLNEIVRARENISAYMAITKNPYETRLMYLNDRSPYVLKVRTIKDCLHAVDVEPSAVDIARLRLWLSLVIDDEINPNAQNPLDGHTNPIPLPNLECNIVCGNSLIDEFEGVALINKASDISDNIEQVDIYTERYNAVLPTLFKAQDELFYCSDIEQKRIIKLKIAALKDEIIKVQLQNAPESLINDYKKTKTLASLPYILWQIDFAKPFREKGGFDIIVGNPPYIDSETMVNIGLQDERKFISENYKFAKGNWDIYIAFFEKGYRLLNQCGNLIYISPDKWISKPFGKQMRISLKDNIVSILKAGRDVFDSANVDSIVTLISKSKTDKIQVYQLKKKNEAVEYVRSVKKSLLIEPYILDIIFSPNIDLIEKMNLNNEKLGQHFTCENACATSDCYTLKDILYSLDCEEDYNSGKQYKIINTGTIGRYFERWGKSEMKYLKDKYAFPVVDKSDFHNTFPNSYGAKADKKKIIIKGLTLLDASIDIKGEIIPGKTTMMISCDDTDELKLLCAYINSKISIFYIKQRYSSSSYNGGINFTKDMINSLPWFELSDNKREEIVDIVDEILMIKKSSNSSTIDLEDKVNEILYKAFDFTTKEIGVIDRES